MNIDLNAIQFYTSPQNYRWGCNHYFNIGFIRELMIDKKKNLYNINAKVSDIYTSHTIKVVLDDNYNIKSTSCDCRYNTSYLICGHIVGTLLAINRIQPSTFPYKDSGEFNRLIRQEITMKEIEQKRIETENMILKTNVALDDLLSGVQYQILDDLSEKQQNQIVANCQINSGENIVILNFKIGCEKKYVVKNVEALLHQINVAQVVRYGKALSFKHTLSVFDTFTQKTISVIRELLFDNMYDCSRKELYIYSGGIDLFFDHYYGSDMQYIDFEINVEDSNLKLVIKQNEDGYYYVELDGDEEIVYSPTNVYRVGDKTFTRLVSPHSDIIASLIESYKIGRFSMLDKKALDKLISLLNNMTPAIEYTLDFEYTTNIAEVLTKMYVDIIGDDLQITMECYYEDAKTINPLSKSDEYALSVATTTLLGYLSTLGTVVDEKLICPVHSSLTERFIHEDIEKVKNYCEVYVSESIKRLTASKPISISIGMRTKNNLLEVDLSTLDFDIKELKFMMQAIQKSKKYYHLKNGEVIKLENDAMIELDKTMQKFNIKSKDIVNGKIKLPLYRSFEFNQMVDTEVIRIERKDSFKKMISNYNDKAKQSVNKNYDNILRPYQREGVEWMMSLSDYGFGGILADDMGLGKTLQVISLLDSVKCHNNSIVVCPAVLLYNWQDEVAKFSKTLNCVVVSGDKKQRKDIVNSIKEPSLIVTTYDYVRSDYHLYEDISFDYMIIDEAQYIKNHATKSAKTIKMLNATNKIALTGTPIENTLAELWSIFDFLMPGYLFEYSHFAKNFERKIVKDNDLLAQSRLKQMVEPFILRRMKKDVLTDLPDKIEQVLTFRFNSDEQNLYLAKLASVNEDLQNQLQMDKVNKVMILSMLTQLRQVCCDSRLITDSIKVPSTKVNGCLDLIENLTSNNRNVLLFSAFTSVLGLIEQELKKRYIPYFVITGTVSKEERRSLVERFQKGEVPVFLISLKAGGVGLNLTNASAVIHFDPWWNISAQNQATDRAYRIGQQEDVQVYKLIMKDSIEEKILKLQEKKKELSEIFVENSDGSIAAMDVDSIVALLNNDIK